MSFGCVKKGGSVPLRHQQPSSHFRGEAFSKHGCTCDTCGLARLTSAEHGVGWRNKGVGWHNKNAGVFHVLPDEVKPVLWIKKGLIL